MTVDWEYPRPFRNIPTSFGVNGQRPSSLCSVEFILLIFQWLVLSLWSINNISSLKPQLYRMTTFFMFSLVRIDAHSNQLPHYSQFFGFNISETIGTTSESQHVFLISQMQCNIFPSTWLESLNQLLLCHRHDCSEPKVYRKPHRTPLKCINYWDLCMTEKEMFILLSGFS